MFFASSAIVQRKSCGSAFRNSCRLCIYLYSVHADFEADFDLIAAPSMIELAFGSL